MVERFGKKIDMQQTLIVFIIIYDIYQFTAILTIAIWVIRHENLHVKRFKSDDEPRVFSRHDLLLLIRRVNHFLFFFQRKDNNLFQRHVNEIVNGKPANSQANIIDPYRF